MIQIRFKGMISVPLYKSSGRDTPNGKTMNKNEKELPKYSRRKGHSQVASCYALLLALLSLFAVSC